MRLVLATCQQHNYVACLGDPVAFVRSHIKADPAASLVTQTL